MNHARPPNATKTATGTNASSAASKRSSAWPKAADLKLDSQLKLRLDELTAEYRRGDAER